MAAAVDATKLLQRCFLASKHVTEAEELKAECMILDGPRKQLRRDHLDYDGVICNADWHHLNSPGQWVSAQKHIEAR